MNIPNQFGHEWYGMFIKLMSHRLNIFTSSGVPVSLEMSVSHGNARSGLARRQMAQRIGCQPLGPVHFREIVSQPAISCHMTESSRDR